MPALKPIKLFIGLPIYSQVPAFFLQSLLALQARKPLFTADGREIKVHIQMSQGDGVARSRNQLTADFIAGDFTHLLFIDCDLIFSAEHVIRIVSHNLPIVGGLYPKKQEGPIEWVLNSLPNTEPDEDGLHEVRYIGTGFMCIRRDVIEKMIHRLGPQIEFTADYGQRRVEYDLWPMGVYTYPDKSRRYLSEDWYFCQRLADLGGAIFADTRIIVKHIGPAIYPLVSQEQELFRAVLRDEKQSQQDHLPAASGGRTDLCIDRAATPVAVPQTALANERV